MIQRSTADQPPVKRSPLPVAADERAGILDALRGFALLGICLANAGVLSLYVFRSETTIAAMPTAAVDQPLRAFELAFIDGKFYSLFSLLFGIGFAIIFYRKEEGRSAGLRIFYRRLFFLMLFGLAHCLLVWDGDILFFYAVVGAFLPLFRGCSNRTLVLLAAALLLLPLVQDGLRVLSNGAIDPAGPVRRQVMVVDAASGIRPDNFASWLLTHPRYADLRAWNWSGFLWSWVLRLESGRVFKVLAMFLLGLAAGRSRLYLRLGEHRALLRRLRFWGFLIGIPAGLLRVYFIVDGRNLPAAGGLWDTVAYTLNVAPLSLAYASTFCLWQSDGRFPRLFALLQPVGRMALTNYIAQSVIGVLLYYGIGLGLGRQAGPALFFPLCFATYALELAWSRWWMARFAFGPLEWVWRQLTYGRRLSIRKPVTAAGETLPV